MDEKAKDLTFGGKAVGLTFNPSGNTEVQHIKEQAANFIDSFYSGSPSNSGEQEAMRKLALRRAQEAQMWAVKAATWSN